MMQSLFFHLPLFFYWCFWSTFLASSLAFPNSKRPFTGVFAVFTWINQTRRALCPNHLSSLLLPFVVCLSLPSLPIHSIFFHFIHVARVLFGMLASCAKCDSFLLSQSVRWTLIYSDLPTFFLFLPWSKFENAIILQPVKLYTKDNNSTGRLMTLPLWCGHSLL